MGKSWDSFVPGPSVWREVYRVLKPGAHLLVFAGTRTEDLMGMSVRLAGFERRDTFAWLYATGFPKNLDVGKAIDKAAGAEREVVGVRGTKAAGLTDTGYTTRIPDTITAPATDDAKAWDGWGTALKPAHEPVLVFRKPLAGTVAANVLAHGTGALNIDGCRIGFASEKDERESKEKNRHGDFDSTPPVRVAFGEDNREGRNYDAPGRWPANVVLDEEAAALLDAQTGESVSRKGKPRASKAPGDGWGMTSTGAEYDDAGGASRFFYVAKASRSEREEGCESLAGRDATTVVDRDLESAGVQNPRAGAGRGAGAPRYRCAKCDLHLGGGRAATPCSDGGTHEKALVGHGPVVKNHHPTVKPVALMRWLVRLVTPPGGVVLDPYTGSGTTGVAALQEGFNFIGAERDLDDKCEPLGYMQIIQARLEHAEFGGDNVAARGVA